MAAVACACKGAEEGGNAEGGTAGRCLDVTQEFLREGLDVTPEFLREGQGWRASCGRMGDADAVVLGHNGRTRYEERHFKRVRCAEGNSAAAAQRPPGTSARGGRR